MMVACDALSSSKWRGVGTRASNSGTGGQEGNTICEDGRRDTRSLVEEIRLAKISFRGAREGRSDRSTDETGAASGGAPPTHATAERHFQK